LFALFLEMNQSASQLKYLNFAFADVWCESAKHLEERLLRAPRNVEEFTEWRQEANHLITSYNYLVVLPFFATDASELQPAPGQEIVRRLKSCRERWVTFLDSYHNWGDDLRQSSPTFREAWTSTTRPKPFA
jgi:hypothetical protein